MADLAWVWQKYETNVISYQQLGYVLCFSWKWLGEKKVHSLSLPEFKGYKDNKTNDLLLCKELWKLFDEADVLIAHNWDRFDVKKAMTRFLVHGFAPPSPCQTADTKKIAKKYFNFNSNALDDLADQLGIGRKLQTGGWPLWLGVAVEDDPKAWSKMIAYCRQDTALLWKVYLRMRPYATSHPNRNIYSQTLDKCPACGGRIIRNGWRPTMTGKYQRFSCTQCGKWSPPQNMEKKMAHRKGS